MNQLQLISLSNLPTLRMYLNDSVFMTGGVKSLCTGGLPGRRADISGEFYYVDWLRSANLNSQVNHKKLKIAYHETGHAVMALICRQEVQKISLKEMDSPRGTDKYHAFMKLEPVDPKTKFTGEKAIQKIMISLGGYASETLLSGGSANIGGDDLMVAANTAEAMLQIEDFKSWASTLPVPSSSALDMIENPLVRAYIDYKMGDCIKALTPRWPLIQLIAEELYKREELTGDEVSVLFHSFVQPSLGGDQKNTSIT